MHAELRERGFPGCDVFDCFGAGQRVVQVVFGIIAGLAANRHENYRYPFAIRFIK